MLCHVVSTVRFCCIGFPCCFRSVKRPVLCVALGTNNPLSRSPHHAMPRYLCTLSHLLPHHAPSGSSSSSLSSFFVATFSSRPVASGCLFILSPRCVLRCGFYRWSFDCPPLRFSSFRSPLLSSGAASFSSCFSPDSCL